MTPSGTEPSTFRYVTRHLNHCATAIRAGSFQNMDAIKQLRKQQQQQLLPNGVARDTSCGEETTGTSQENYENANA